MVAEWFYTEQGQRRGPVTWQQLQQLAAGGQLKPADLVWKNGMAQWSPASSQAGLFGGAPAPAPPPAAPPAPPAPKPQAPAAPAWSAPVSTPSQPAPTTAPIPPPSSPTPGPQSAPTMAPPGPAAKAGMSKGFKLALLAGGAGVVFLVLCCGVLGIFVVLPLLSSNEKSWKLEANKALIWERKFSKDEDVEISVAAKAEGKMALAVFKTKEAANSFVEKGQPTDMVGGPELGTKDFKVTFKAPETQTYYVVLMNVEPANEGKLTAKATAPK
jgi:hypothetical protein